MGDFQSLIESLEINQELQPMITMLGQGLLHDIHRNRAEMQDKLDKRKTFLLVCLITICVTIATTLWIVYS